VLACFKHCLVHLLALGHKRLQRCDLEGLHHRPVALDERALLESSDLGLDSHHLVEASGYNFCL
jgi:hypothetical protein